MQRSGPREVVAVSRNAVHELSKAIADGIVLVAGHGVQGDAHAGVTVQHRSLVRADRTAPNLRQVHLLHAELLDELCDGGFDVAPGQLGENVTTRGVDLLGLPRSARLHLGARAVVEVTGLRNPCRQLDRFRPMLMAAVLDRDEQGRLVRKAGVMGVVVAGGTVRSADPVQVELPTGAHVALRPV